MSRTQICMTWSFKMIHIRCTISAQSPVACKWVTYVDCMHHKRVCHELKYGWLALFRWFTVDAQNPLRVLWHVNELSKLIVCITYLCVTNSYVWLALFRWFTFDAQNPLRVLSHVNKLPQLIVCITNVCVTNSYMYDLLFSDDSQWMHKIRSEFCGM